MQRQRGPLWRDNEPMTLGELIGPEAGLPPSWSRLPIAGLTADSRAVKPGYLFAALPGVNTDGARFIAEALQRGAAAILLGKGDAPALNGTPVVEDADPRRRLSLRHRPIGHHHAPRV